jgi:predicted nucleic acid-binding protein
LIRTFIDSGVLIAAATGTDDVAAKALEVLDDPKRRFTTSDLVRLEVLPKAIYHGNQAEADFYEEYFRAARRTVHASQKLVAQAQEEACTTGLAAMDALHVAAAKVAKSAEFITTEKSTKPVFRVAGIAVKTLRPDT